MTVATGEIEPLSLFAGAKHINPAWSPDGRSLYFISDRGGYNDIFRLDVARRQEGDAALYQVTRLATGVAGIADLSPAISVSRQTGALAYSVFEGQRYTVYRTDAARGAGHARPARPLRQHGHAAARRRRGPQPRRGLPRRRPRGPARRRATFPTRDYRSRLSLDYISQPQVGVGYDPSYGGVGVGGGVAFLFSDQLSDNRSASPCRPTGPSRTSARRRSTSTAAGASSTARRSATSRSCRPSSAARPPARPYLHALLLPDVHRPGRGHRRLPVQPDAAPRGQRRLHALRFWPPVRRLRHATRPTAPGATYLRRPPQRRRLRPVARSTSARPASPSSATTPTSASRRPSAAAATASPSTARPARSRSPRSRRTTGATTSCACRACRAACPITFAGARDALRPLRRGRGRQPPQPALPRLRAVHPRLRRRLVPGRQRRVRRLPGPPARAPASASPRLELRMPLLGVPQLGLLTFPFLPTELVLFADAGMAWGTYAYVDGLGRGGPDLRPARSRTSARSSRPASRGASTSSARSSSSPTTPSRSRATTRLRRRTATVDGLGVGPRRVRHQPHAGLVGERAVRRSRPDADLDLPAPEPHPHCRGSVPRPPPAPVPPRRRGGARRGQSRRRGSGSARRRPSAPSSAPTPMPGWRRRSGGCPSASPLGLAAGFDKNARLVRFWEALGLGWVDVGSVTNEAAPGNARPRAFRLPADARARQPDGPQQRRRRGRRRTPGRAGARVPGFVVSVNVAKTHRADPAGARRRGRHRGRPAGHRPAAARRRRADGQRVVPQHGRRQDVRDAARARRPARRRRPRARRVAAAGRRVPLLVKLSPDAEGVPELVAVALARGADGFVATNTASGRDGLATRCRDARPDRARRALRAPARAARARPRRARSTARRRAACPLVGVGGIDSAEAAYARIRAGASLVQLYTALVYEGPGVVRAITRGLAERPRPRRLRVRRRGRRRGRLTRAPSRYLRAPHCPPACSAASPPNAAPSARRSPRLSPEARRAAAVLLAAVGARAGPDAARHARRLPQPRQPARHGRPRARRVGVVVRRAGHDGLRRAGR